MRSSIRFLIAGTFALALALPACQRDKTDKKKDETKPVATGEATGEATGKTGAARPQPEQIAAPPDVAAAPADADKTASGIAHKVLTKGTGAEHPAEWDRVKVHYTGWTTDGKMFDSSVKKGRPATFPLKGVIAGWTEGVQLMVEGEKRRFWIPEAAAYKGAPGKPAGMLVFEIELLEIKRAPKPIPAPKDVAAPPANAKKTDSGLAYKVLSKGKGGENPTKANMVEVHYTGWTTDGKMFDSSVARGKPATFPVARVIPGWTEGLQLMTTGDKYRLWIPAKLAYEGKPGRPQGMLVFDVELLSIKATPPRPIPSGRPIKKQPANK